MSIYHNDEMRKFLLLAENYVHTDPTLDTLPTITNDEIMVDTDEKLLSVVNDLIGLADKWRNNRSLHEAEKDRDLEESFFLKAADALDNIIQKYRGV